MGHSLRFRFFFFFSVQLEAIKTPNCQLNMERTGTVEDLAFFFLQCAGEGETDCREVEVGPPAEQLPGIWLQLPKGVEFGGVKPARLTSLSHGQW